jgi:hypothetical protein
VSGKARGSRTTDNWKFYQDASNRWRWKYVMQGKTVAQAYSTFERYGDCVNDARTHGYRGSAQEQT